MATHSSAAAEDHAKADAIYRVFDVGQGGVSIFIVTAGRPGPFQLVRQRSLLRSDRR